jgi:hypothetical protein
MGKVVYFPGCDPDKFLVPDTLEHTTLEELDRMVAEFEDNLRRMNLTLVKPTFKEE